VFVCFRRALCLFVSGGHRVCLFQEGTVFVCFRRALCLFVSGGHRVCLFQEGTLSEAMVLCGMLARSLDIRVLPQPLPPSGPPSFRPPAALWSTIEYPFEYPVSSL
jgi:hypothetical protein